MSQLLVNPKKKIGKCVFFDKASNLEKGSILDHLLMARYILRKENREETDFSDIPLELVEGLIAPFASPPWVNVVPWNHMDCTIKFMTDCGMSMDSLKLRDIRRYIGSQTHFAPHHLAAVILEKDKPPRFVTPSSESGNELKDVTEGSLIFIYPLQVHDYPQPFSCTCPFPKEKWCFCGYLDKYLPGRWVELIDLFRKRGLL